MTVEFQQLRYFVAVAEELNFRKAAERLHIAQPPLSRKIRQLEQALEVELLRRTTRQIELTAAGKVYLEEVRQILSQVQQASTLARLAERGQVGHLRIGFEGSSAYDVVPVSVKVFKEKSPLIAISAFEMATGDQGSAIREGQIEIGFGVLSRFDGNNLTVKTIMQDPLVAVLPQNHPLADHPRIDLRALRNETFIICPRRYRCGLYDHTLAVCHQAGFSPKLIQETQEVHSILGFVAAGLGVALLPLSVKSLLRSQVIYRPFDPPLEGLDLAMAWRPENESPTLSVFLEVVQQVVDQLSEEKQIHDVNTAHLEEVTPSH